MKTTIYIRLLNEGTVAYRPVSAFEIGNNIYEIDRFEVYGSEDEQWEFEPGTRVIVQQQQLSGELVKVATREANY